MITRMHDWLANMVWIVLHYIIAAMEMDSWISLRIWLESNERKKNNV